MQRCLQLCKQKLVGTHMNQQREGGQEEKVGRKQENKRKSDYTLTHTTPHHSWKMKAYLWRKLNHCRTCGFHVFHVLLYIYSIRVLLDIYRLYIYTYKHIYIVYIYIHKLYTYIYHVVSCVPCVVPITSHRNIDRWA
jgi:hypothetical protein